MFEGEKVKICQNCNKQYKSRKKTSKFCSKACFYIGRSKRKRIWIKRKCLQCGKIFNGIPSEVKRNRAIFCTKKCYLEWRRKQRLIKCENCGKIFERHNIKRRYCSRKCFDMALNKGLVHKYKVWKDKNGYMLRGKKGGTIFEHRFVWENHYGSIPEGWIVHHLNGNRSDNRIENLVAMPRKRHSPIIIIETYRKRIIELEKKIYKLKKGG